MLFDHNQLTEVEDKADCLGLKSKRVTHHEVECWAQLCWVKQSNYELAVVPLDCTWDLRTGSGHLCQRQSGLWGWLSASRSQKENSRTVLRTSVEESNIVKGTGIFLVFLLWAEKNHADLFHFSICLSMWICFCFHFLISFSWAALLSHFTNESPMAFSGSHIQPVFGFQIVSTGLCHVFKFTYNFSSDNATW